MNSVWPVYKHASSPTDDENRISYSTTCTLRHHMLATSEHQTHKSAYVTEHSADEIKQYDAI
jgi:hypothetical protein